MHCIEQLSSQFCCLTDSDEPLNLLLLFPRSIIREDCCRSEPLTLIPVGAQFSIDVEGDAGSRPIAGHGGLKVPVKNQNTTNGYNDGKRTLVVVLSVKMFKLNHRFLKNIVR